MSAAILPAHEVTVFLAELAVMLVVARALGTLARRMGQPSLAGELVGGVLLGPSIAGKLWPSLWRLLFPPEQHGSGPVTLLLGVGQIGLVLLMFRIGAETDLGLLRRLGKASSWVSGLGLGIPLVVGVVLGVAAPGRFVAPGGNRVAFVVLLAAAVGVSSLPVIAGMLRELGLMRRNFAQVLLAAGTANDLVGFLLLAVATGIAGAGAGASPEERILRALIGLALIGGSLAIAGRRSVDALMRRLRREGPAVAGSFTLAVVLAFAAAAAVSGVGLDAALGGFFAGLIVGGSRFKHAEALNSLELATAAVFSPLYFATAGFAVDVTVFDRPEVLLGCAAVLAGGAVAKLAGGLVGARVGGLGQREGVAVALGLNGRGTMQVIIATAGLGAGIFDRDSYAVVVVTAIATALVVSPVLRRAADRAEAVGEERERLRHEEELATNVVLRGQRVLLASRGGRASRFAAELMHEALPKDSALTVVRVEADQVGPGAQEGSQATQTRALAAETSPDEPDEPEELPSARMAVALAGIEEDRSTERRLLPSGSSCEAVAEALLGEARLGYGLVVVGAPGERLEGCLFSPMVDALMPACDLPLVVVRLPKLDSHRAEDNRDDRHTPVVRDIRRVIVPVAGTATSRAAEEVAGHLSASIGAELVLLHVVAGARESRIRIGARAFEPMAMGRRLLVEARSRARTLGADAKPRLVGSGRPAEALLDEVERTGADLVVLAATARQTGNRTFLGYRVQYVIEAASVPVVLVVMPDVPGGA